ncbi:MAG: cytidylate kinase family protein [Deltaproteobacteria bacterium]|nr:cytidylate kinase family protein [Deltaproteobacteria bacterium]
MAIIMISSNSVQCRQELALDLSRKTGWPCLSREQLLERAREQGIKIGRLEISVIKNSGRYEKLAREKELYLAFLTAALCEKARQGNLIYHGRAGHLLLPGVSHRLRVGIMVPKEKRVEEVMSTMNLGRDKAWSYVEQLDEDLAKWFHFIHGVDLKDQGQYDFIFNLENLSRVNSATLLCAMAELPDFRPTPASCRALENLDLAARAKLRLAKDPRTAEADLTVRAESGILTVTYMPRQEEVSIAIPAVLGDLDGYRELICTMAETNILWVQERFTSQEESFNQLVHLAQRWGAAVELLRLLPPETMGGNEPTCNQIPSKTPATSDFQVKKYCGGVEDDEPENLLDDGGMRKTLEKLVALGRSGGGHTAVGGHEKILETLRGERRQALIVLGDLFLSKDQTVRTRQTRELALTIKERLKSPVITVNELRAKYMFGKEQAVILVLFVAVLLALYGLVFQYQDLILNIMGGELHQKFKWLTLLVVAMLVPIVAYLYGTVTGLVLKLIDID